MGLFGLKPARETAKAAVVIADLDKLIAEPIAFRFDGKTHLINPISTKEFFRVTANLAKMDELKAKSEVSAEELIDAYTNLISSVCETIGRKEIENMTQAQVGALFQLVLDCVTGKAQAGTEKKNLMPTQ